jgi:energy-converting hydrogenase Eha subunit B
MKSNHNRLLGIALFTLLFPITAPLMQCIPNPMVPGAIVSLNMILPILAGYFYGAISGMIVGGTGALFAALLQANQFYLAGVYSMGLVGALAGWIGRHHRAEIPAATTIILSHIINILVLIRVGMLDIPPERIGVTLLGLTAESAIDIIATMLVIATLKQWLYQTERW